MESHAANLPEWYPPWARQLAELYFSGTTCMFLLHGNVHDLIRSPDGDGATYSNLPEFLATQVFGSWDIVLAHDAAKGLRPLAGSNAARLQSMVKYLSARLGEVGTWPREPDRVLAAIDQLVERNLLEEKPEQRKRIAVVFEYAQYLAPAGDLATVARSDAGRLVRLLTWAQNPYIKRLNIAFCLVAEKLTELNDRLVRDPHVGTIAVPMPDTAERERFAQWLVDENAAAATVNSREIAETSSGLGLVSLQVLLSQRGAANDDRRRLGEVKKSLIERQCLGLVEFVEPRVKLDLVVGHGAAIEQLKQDADWILRGKLDTAPMGYLICGPVGTGKTFLAECYAGEIGIPCVKLRNFRSKYVGETEGNLEQVLTVLRSLGPVVVIIDEADAALGDRTAEGDSGTSSRMFSMIAAQMGDTAYRGRIIWMLLTSRPDRLPIDLKRQGRAEVHIPLFYPHDADEIAAMLRAMARKNKISLPDNELAKISPDRNLSGADLESIVLAGRRAALAEKRDKLTAGDIERAADEFIPSAQGLEKEMQEIAAVLECTQRKFLTPAWRQRVAQPAGRTELQERMAAIRQLLEKS
ncbi:MAG TPA: AAA family ATPase [Pirellulales bacterium]|jgi:AAA+ superfamily predicted ATPase|nr:AAA family ATPase [Pirellulales bacterium]